MFMTVIRVTTMVSNFLFLLLITGNAVEYGVFVVMLGLNANPDPNPNANPKLIS